MCRVAVDASQSGKLWCHRLESGFSFSIWCAMSSRARVVAVGLALAGLGWCVERGGCDGYAGGALMRCSQSSSSDVAVGSAGGPGLGRGLSRGYVDPGENSVNSTLDFTLYRHGEFSSLTACEKSCSEPRGKCIWFNHAVLCASQCEKDAECPGGVICVCRSHECSIGELSKNHPFFDFANFCVVEGALGDE